MNKVLHKAETRGVADHDWLTSYHSFSFADYYNPERMGFGRLRVINDDRVKPGKGFNTHPHSNMEIISIPLSGSLRHQDSMGNHHIISSGEIQIMSAGSGISHSEFNHSSQQEVAFLQIWIEPQREDIEPCYGQKSFADENRMNRFDTLIAPQQREESLWINQQAWLSMANLEKGSRTPYERQKKDNGLYFFVIEGHIQIESEKLSPRDGIGITESSLVEIEALGPAQVLCIEVPMNN